MSSAGVLRLQPARAGEAGGTPYVQLKTADVDSRVLRNYKPKPAYVCYGGTVHIRSPTKKSGQVS